MGFVFLASEVYGQEDNSLLTIRYNYSSGEGIPFKTFTLYQGTDSIISGTTDEQGELKLNVQFEFLTDYEIREANNPEWKRNNFEFRTEDYLQDYIVNMSTMYLHPKHKSASPAYFRLNDVSKIEEFEVEFLKSIITEHPNICIELSQTINQFENEEIALLRKENFLKFLDANGVDMSCILFTETIHKLPIDWSDQRSRIELALSSLELKCR